MEALDPPPIRAVLYLTRGFRRRGRFAEARSVLELGEAAYPDRLRLLVERAELARASGQVEEAIEAWDAATGVAGAEADPRWVFRSAQLLEAEGRVQEAAEAYARAIAMLGSVDRPWVHKARPEWRFRECYCRALLGEVVPDDRRLGVRISPAGIRPAIIPPDAPGVVWAEVQGRGLLFRGAVDDDVEEVSIGVDGVELRQTETVDGPRRQFRFLIRHSLLDRYPPRSTIQVSAGGAPLVAGGEDERFTLEVPHGQGDLLDRLSASWSVTKKGHLAHGYRIGGHEPAEILAAYSDARWVFSHYLDVDLFLLYGSLLGCHRDGRLIPGDDDLDVGYLTAATDGTTFKAEVVPAVASLLEAGFDVQTRRGGALFKVTIAGVKLDVYPIWFSDGKAWGYDAVTATPDDYLPATQTEMAGREVLVPRRPEVILAGTYGSDWRTPNPNFRHKRSAELRRRLRTTYLTPSETDEILRQNADSRADRARDVGTFRLHI